MRLTEALHFYRSPKRPTEKWMQSHYSHFSPTAEDEKLRKRLNEDGVQAIHDDNRVRKKKRLKELFD